MPWPFLTQLTTRSDGTGADAMTAQTHAIFIFRGEPEEYNLPAVSDVPTVHLRSGWQSAAVAAGLMLAGVAAAFFTRD